MAAKLLNLGLLAAAVVVSLFVSDFVLALLDFPDEPRLSAVRPVNFEEFRDNLEFRYLFRTNGRGLRYAEISTARPPNVRRIVVSGDSYTEGVGLEEGRRFTDLLERDFRFRRQMQFINGGLSGSGPLEYGRLFMSVGLEYSPDALLLCVFVNDAANTPEDLGDYFLDGPQSARTGIKRFAHFAWPHLYSVLKDLRTSWRHRRRKRTSDFLADVTAAARDRGVAESRIERWRTALPAELVSAVNQVRFDGAILSHSLLYPGYWRDSIDVRSEQARRKWENMTRVLGELVDRCRHHGIEVGVVLIPSAFQYDRARHVETNPWIMGGADVDLIWLQEETAIQERMRTWADTAAVPILDLTPVFRAAAERGATLNWRLDGHWNGAGHELAADAIASWLCEGGVFSFVESRGCRTTQSEVGESGA